jgi:hypothetical protein
VLVSLFKKKKDKKAVISEDSSHELKVVEHIIRSFVELHLIVWRLRMSQHVLGKAQVWEVIAVSGKVAYCV